MPKVIWACVFWSPPLTGRFWRTPGLQTQWGLALGGHHKLGRRLWSEGEARGLHQCGQVCGLDFRENSNGMKEFNGYHSMVLEDYSIEENLMPLMKTLGCRIIHCNQPKGLGV